MALAGDEKKIRALFSELAIEDQNCAPRFESLWNKAQNRASTGAAPIRRFRTSAAVITFVAVSFVAAVVLAVWSWSAKPTMPTPQNAVNIAPRIAPTPTAAAPEANNHATSASQPRSHRRSRKNIEKRRNAEWATAVEMISRWQSPTNILMNSPTEVGFNSLPQLNESAEALKQFLPRNNETMKESNQ
jgi:hypothetical protein